jgi:hypothetical protein
MRDKHPTLGKRTLAEMYFLRKDVKLEGELDQNSPLPDETAKKGYLNFKNYK